MTNNLSTADNLSRREYIATLKEMLTATPANTAIAKHIAKLEAMTDEDWPAHRAKLEQRSAQRKQTVTRIMSELWPCDPGEPLSKRKNPSNGFTVLLKDGNGTRYVQHHDHTSCFPLADVGTVDPFDVIQLAKTYKTRSEAVAALDGFTGWADRRIAEVKDNKVVIPAVVQPIIRRRS